MAFGQIDSTTIHQKVIKLQDHKLLLIDSISISPYYFVLKTMDNKTISKNNYTIDFAKAQLTFKDTLGLAQQYRVYYRALPQFLTQSYHGYDTALILKPTQIDSSFISTKPLKRKQIPFEGLQTKGSFSRGVTLGNNSDMVVNSAIDLQLAGEIKQGVTLRAVIRDDNLPRQQIGYSENIKEFDEVFIALEAKKWQARGGDMSLKNRDYFLNFTKKIQGARYQYAGNHFNIEAAGALVKGQFGKYDFQGEEGNQGPYKIKGKNNEVYLLLVNDSEKVYSNGRLLERGASKDYIIDYQNAEIIFNPTFPISAKDRIQITYQYTDRSYTRLLTFAKTGFQQKKWTVSASIYTENDAKNSPLQQELTALQKTYLRQAGDDETLMQAPSEVATAYAENKILYKKVLVGTSYYYEFSNLETDELFYVRFTNVGSGNGAYNIASTNAIGTIYEYVGTGNGAFAPTVRLIAPNKLQVLTFDANYTPSEKTSIQIATGLSNYDENLFSTLDDNDNRATAFKTNIKQQLINKKWQIWTQGSFEHLARDFKAVERLQKIDFNYKWNIQNAVGNQDFFQAGISGEKDENTYFNYKLQQLQLGETKGVNHIINANYQYKKWLTQFNTNQLASSSALEYNNYNYLTSKISFTNPKAQYRLAYEQENTLRKNKITASLNPLSRGFSQLESAVFLGEKNTKNIELSYALIKNDSVLNNTLQRKSTTNSYRFSSRFIQNKQGNAHLFVNYRTSVFDADNSQINSLNSKFVLHYNFWKKLMQWNTKYNTLSGKLPQQEYTFVATESGLGYYKWNDYNSNGIQELDEFEVAQFQDEANYIRVLLPTKNYIKTFQNGFTQSIVINPIQWQQSKSKSKRFLSKFYLQSHWSIDQKNKQLGTNFDLNPFQKATENTLSLLSRFQNDLYYNRGKKKYALHYEYLDLKNRTLLSIGLQEQYNQSHGLYLKHQIKMDWRLDLTGKSQKSIHFATNNPNANHKIKTTLFKPELNYKASAKTQFSTSYSLVNKQNTIGNLETLKQQVFALKIHHQSSKKFSLDLDFQYYINDFLGNTNSPIAYFMLGGLQQGKNEVWQLLIHKKINSFMDLNINYNGRKATTSGAIHNASVQLKAYF